MKKCVNCGAGIKSDVTKCPYCGYINLEGAEKKYIEDLNDIKNDIEEVKKEPERELKRGISKGAAVALCTVGILGILAAFFFAMLIIELKDRPKEFLSPEEQAFASAYKETAQEELREAYDNKNIEKMAMIYDKATTQDRVSIWGIDHYESAYASDCYVKLMETLPALSDKDRTKHDCEAITYYCFYFYYRAYGEDGREIFDPIRNDEIVPILTDRLGFTIEDMGTFREKVTDKGLVNRSAVYRETKKYFKDYH